jgi:hypothetical protein
MQREGARECAHSEVAYIYIRRDFHSEAACQFPYTEKCTVGSNGNVQKVTSAEGGEHDWLYAHGQRCTGRRHGYFMQ